MIGIPSGFGRPITTVRPIQQPQSELSPHSARDGRIHDAIGIGTYGRVKEV